MSKAKTTANGKPLRFASLIRVSGEKQEKEGESLRTQTADNIRCVESLDGKIVETYGGQEHATPGYEKKEVNRLLHDATLKKFDAVIVANVLRWSRDNQKSKQGLEVFRDHDIEFYIGMAPQDLFNPSTRLFLGMAAEIGEYQAGFQSQQSLMNRIARAKRGIPTAGNLPFGRTFDKETGKWDIDKDCQAMMTDVAKRYLAGETLKHIAAEYDVDLSQLRQNLLLHSGTTYKQHFGTKRLKIDETVPFTIPPLLDDETIQKCRDMKERNKAISHKDTDHKYLLSGYLFCGGCDEHMKAKGLAGRQKFVYLHKNGRDTKPCPYDPRPYIREAELDEAVIRHLLEFFGNPPAIEQAMQKAFPNLAKIEELTADLARLDASIAKINRTIENLERTAVEVMKRGIVPSETIDAEIEKLKAQRAPIQARRDQTEAIKDQLPTPERIKEHAEQVSESVRGGFSKKPRQRVSSRKYNALKAGLDFESLTWDEKRSLIEHAFQGTGPNGKPCGVYIRTIPGQAQFRYKSYRFELVGNLAIYETKGRIPYDPVPPDVETIIHKRAVKNAMPAQGRP